MKRLFVGAAVSVLALPAGAMAAGNRGVVLSVSRAHHSIEVVDSGRVVHSYGYRGRLPKLHAGSVVTFSGHGATISHVRVSSGRSRTVSYYARVVRSGRNRLVLRLADGHTVTFSSKQVRTKKTKHHHSRIAHAADLTAAGGNITVNIQGLTPGATVLITETVDSQGNVTISITLPATTPGGPGNPQQASGVVTDVQTDTFDVQTGDGSTLHFHMAADALANIGMSACDTVDVSYHTDGGLLIADNVNDNGTSNQGDCAGDDSQDEVGPIVAVSGSNITINTQDQGQMTFVVDPSSGITDGFVVGDVVDVTYSQNGSELDASDVEYVQNDSTGVVTSVSDGSVTVTDDSTGQSETFVADPSAGMFSGVAVGDEIDVTWHQSGTQMVADYVDDVTADNANDG